jgi:2-oxoglutarate ferredoxin oxidoreductase subunit gamma
MTAEHGSTMKTAAAGAVRKEIIITGFGGQGIVLAGQIVGKAASLRDHKESTLTQSYGPEARGGACSAQVIISEQTIHYPYVRRPDVLICMSQGGFEKYGALLGEHSTLIVDQDLVNVPEGRSTAFFSIPATRLAEEMGRKMMANIVMLGFFTAVAGAITSDAARQTVAESVPKGTEELNMAAFNKGYDYGTAVLKGRQKKAEGKKGAQ